MKMRFFVAFLLTAYGSAHVSNAAASQLPIQSPDTSKTPKSVMAQSTGGVLDKHGSVSFHGDGTVDYTASLANGFPITPNIEQAVGGSTMIKTLSDIHQSMFVNSNIDQRCLIASRALMDKYGRRSIMNGVVGRAVPAFWNLVEKTSHAGEYILTSAAPILSGTALSMSMMQTQSSEDGGMQAYDRATKIAKTASSYAFYIGKYVLGSSIHESSKLLSEYYKNESVEKRYIKATTNFGDEANYVKYLSPRQCSGNAKGVQISESYFKKCGPLITETAREILEHLGQNEIIATEAASKNVKSIYDAYNASSIYSMLSGTCNFISGFFAFGTTLAGIGYSTASGEIFERALYAIQTMCSPLSSLFSGLTTYFSKKSVQYSKRCLLYPIYNPSLLGEMTTSQEDQGLEGIQIE